MSDRMLSLRELADELNIENPALKMTRKKLEGYWRNGMEVAQIGMRYYTTRQWYNEFLARAIEAGRKAS
jgi:hypothetical protein